MSNDNKENPSPLPCIVCKKEMTRDSPVQGNHPRNGLSFEARGQRGSVFDVPDESIVLIVTICDGCLDVNGKEGRLAARQQVVPIPKPPTSYGPYQIYGDEE